MLTEVSCDRSDLGMVKFLYPGYPVVKGLSFLTQAKGVIFVSDQVLPELPYHVVQVRQSAQYRLDSREGFTAFLEDVRGVKLPAALKGLDDDAFWVQAKLFVVSGIYSGSSKGGGSIFDLFRVLFGGFEEKYRIYRSIGRPHQSVFSALTTMMTKVLDAENRMINPHYRKVLLTNKPYLNLYRNRALEYVLTDRKEWDFLNFLSLLNKR